MMAVFNMLITEKDNLPYKQRLANFFYGLDAKWLSQVDTLNFRTDLHRKWAYIDRDRGLAVS
jgi:hypothetical protein